ncbi:MAG TPA: hypothetical protein VKB87_24560 [Myxococcaceae bacterium]|nr:hypothetical protein [Myxococcaceae bacterium]
MISRGVNQIEQCGLPLADWPSPRVTTWINVAQVAVWTAIAMAVLPGRGHFTYDQAYFYELSVRVAETLRPPAYGPFISGTSPAVMTPGGSLFLVYSIPFFVFRDPRVGVDWIILLSAFGLLLIDRSLKRLEADSSLRLALISTLTWSMWHGRFTDTFWNANLFLFSTPALFYAAVRNARDEQPSWYWSVLFGLLSALSMQIHASGALAIVACALVWVSQRSQPFRLSRLGLALLGFVAAYVPYFVVELRDQWVNSTALLSAIPPGYDRQAVSGSLGAWLLYPSHAQTSEALTALFTGGWRGRLFGASLAAAGALSGLGLCVRFRPKLIPLLLIPALPLYFRLSGRPFYDHYVVAVLPFLCLPAAAGAAWLLSRPLLRWLAVAYFGAFAASGVALLLAGQQTLRPGDRWNGHTVDYQLERTRHAIASGAAVGSGPGDEGAFVEWVVARRLFHQPLTFGVGSYLCDVDFRLSGTDPPVWKHIHKPLVPLAPNSVFVCDPR